MSTRASAEPTVGHDSPGTLDVFGPAATLAVTGDQTGGDRAGPGADHVDALRHERFQIGSKLGEGGMGIVYRARDTRDGADVALKRMKTSLSGSARHRFEREFRSLAALRHPHCLAVYDYGELGGGPFFTMELFLGQPITALSARPLPERLGPLLQLTHALDYIHGHGIVHRDVKPTNILVRPVTSPDGTSTYESRLMDFGLAKYYGVKSSASAEAGFVGTVAYCSPEQINLDELDHHADLYCLGLVAYEVLSGRYAFPEARLAGMRPLMQAQLADKPRPIGEVEPQVPGPVADAVMKYLRKRPNRRPDSCGALRSAIAECLGVADVTAVSGVSLPTIRRGLSVTGFVCRVREQEAVEEYLESCLRPTGKGERPRESLLVVCGEPGIGKSSVVQEAERLARGHGCQVYEGRCFDGNQSSFQPFVEIARQLLAELRLQERRESEQADVDLTGTHVAGMPAMSLARLLKVVDTYRGELLRVAPELRKYLPGEAYQQVEYGRDAGYVTRALAAFFLEIAAVQPVCLSFEDLQWADRSSLDLLRHLSMELAARRGEPGRESFPRLVIVASARTGYASLESMMVQLRERGEVLELLLEPLSELETRELIALRLKCGGDELSDELVSRVHALCGGNPFFVAETVREWYEKQAITRSESAWVLSTNPGDTTDLPETVRDVMRLRIQGLPAKSQQVLNAACVVGAVVDIDLLREAVPELSESDVLDAIDLLIPRRVFRETANAGRVEFVHDLLRELPYADLSASRRRSLHRRIGELLERDRGRNGVSAAVLAEHFRNAEEPEKGLRYTMEAAEEALEVYAYNNAIALLNEARKILPADADAATRYKLDSMMGRACGCSGRLDDAIHAYQQALAHAQDRIERAAAELGLGENHHRRGEFAEALRHLDAAQREAGRPRPASAAGAMLGIGAESLYFYVLPRQVRGFSRADREPALDLAFAANYLCAQLFASLDLLQYTQACYRAAAIAKQSRKPEHVAVAYSKFAINWGLFGVHRPASYYARAALKAVASRPHDVTWARTMAHVGTSHYTGGRLDEAEAALAESQEVLDKLGDYYATFAHHFLRHLQGVRGDIARELAEAEAELSYGARRGDAEALAWGQYGKANALARAGRTEEAIELASDAATLLHSRGSLAEAVALHTLGFARMQASDYAGARTTLEAARMQIQRTFYLLEFTAPTYPLLVESLLGPHWSEGDGGPARSVARTARRESRFARVLGRFFPNYGPHALRVSGRAACHLGRSRQAGRYFEQSIAAAEKLGARYDLARAYLDASRVIPEKADEYRTRGERLLDELGATVPAAERT